MRSASPITSAGNSMRSPRLRVRSRKIEETWRRSPRRRYLSLRKRSKRRKTLAGMSTKKLKR
jgi:hypothetical protein